MRTIETQVFKYEELSEQAKEKARNWYREGAFDYEWWDCIFDDYISAAKMFGLDISRIFFSGFGQQGSGASFTGEYSFKKGALQAVKKELPLWTELHDICKRLTQMQKPNFYGVSVDITQRDNYCHEMTMSFNVSLCTEGQGERYDIPDDLDEECADIFRDFARMIYRALEQEYDYLNSDEAVDEAIACSEYEFTADGGFTFLAKTHEQKRNFS